MTNRSMLDLTDVERASLDLIAVAHSKNVGNVYFEIAISGYAGGRDGQNLFSDTVNFVIERPGDAVSNDALLEFAVESLRDAGIVLRSPEWTNAFGGFEHHARILPSSLES